MHPEVEELRPKLKEILYDCAGESCGGEDGWLSEHYLYSDARELNDAPPGASGVPGQITEYAFNFPRDQRYIAARLARAEGDVYVSVYVATETFDHFEETRGHALILLDVIETVPMETGKVSVNAAAMARDWGSHCAYAFGWPDRWTACAASVIGSVSQLSSFSSFS